MLEYQLLYDIGIIIIAATVLAYFARLFKQPPILAYMLAGIILGPLVLGIITQRAETMALSELGIAFLLFGAAVDINISKLKGLGTISVVSTLLQVGITALVAYLSSQWLGFGFIESIYIGVIIAFSSTMVIVKLISDSKQLDTLHGRLLIGVLILQDLIIIIVMPMLRMIELPFSFDVLGATVFNGIGLFCLAVVLNKLVFPRLLHFVAKSSELLFLTSITVCFAFMGLANMLGFSLAIGAFLGGLSLSTFYYSTEISGKVRSLRDFFATIFFVTLGLQITHLASFSDVWLILGLTALAVVVKPLITIGLYLLMGYGGRTSLTVGMMLGQVSEFSFIVASSGLLLGHLTQHLFSVIIVVIILSLLVTPYYFQNQHAVFYWVHRVVKTLRLDNFHFFRRRTPEKTAKKVKNHAVLIGCDRMGMQIFEEVKPPLLVVDYNPEVIDRLTAKGVSCIYGDAENEHVIENMDLKNARLVVSTIPSQEATANLILSAKKTRKDLPVFVRASSPEEALLYYSMGADLVVLPEFIAGHKTAEFVREQRKNKEHINEIKKKQIAFLEKTLADKGYLPR